MELIKKLTGKNPSEYEPVAKALVENSDKKLFFKLVQQDDFLFDFVKFNVAKRIQQACNKDNFKNLLSFTNIYSPSYDLMFAEVFYKFGGEEIFDEIKNLFVDGSDSQKAYALKYFTLVNPEKLKEFIADIRNASHSNFEPLAINAIEVLSILNDEVSKNSAIEKLSSDDEFVQYDGVKFLVTFGAKDMIDKIISVMKKSSFSENIASEIVYLMPLKELLDKDYESGLLVLCNIVNAIPDILSPASINDFDLVNIFDVLLTRNIDSALAVCLRLAKDKFQELNSNEEYLFDSDKSTKEAVLHIYKLLSKLNDDKLISLLYDELFDESDFVLYAVDFVDEIEELEALLESNNQTLLLKVLTILKEKGSLDDKHKKTALKNITNDNLKQVINAL